MADPVWVDGTTPLNAVNMNKLQTRDEKAVANGYPSLDANGKIPISQIGGGGVDYIGTWNSGVTYKQGDVISYQGFQYLAVNPSTNVPPPTGYTTAVPPNPVNPTDNGKWLQAQGGAMVWNPLALADIPGKGAVNGLATLDANGKVPTAQLPVPALVSFTGYTNNWAAINPTGYYIDTSGFVHLQGIVTTSSGWNNATVASILGAGSLPVGVRPTTATRIFPMAFEYPTGTWYSQGVVLAQPGGSLDFYQYTGALKAGISQLPLDGISWRAGA